MKITPHTIVERHEKYPDATPQLIASYAYQDYRRAIDDLLKYAEVAEHPVSGAVVILISESHFSEWKAGTYSKNKNELI